jgi:hypothetical protein
MKTTLRIIGVVALATSLLAFAEDPPTPPPAAPPEVLPDQQALVSGPSAPAQAAPDTTPTVPAGQWVYTTQYGWVFMPYGDAYSSVPTAGAPSMYVYTSSGGWGWVNSPWLVGVGPSLYFGTYGYASYRWYGQPRYRGGRSAIYAHYGPAVRVNVGGRYHGAYGVGMRGGGFHGGGFHGGGHGGHR